MIVIGILLANVIGLPTSIVPLWRLEYALVAVPAVLQLFLSYTIVESPRWLVSQNRIDEARHALTRLRGKKANIDGEFYEIVQGQLGSAAAASVAHNPETTTKPIARTERGDDEEESLRGVDDSAVGPLPDEGGDADGQQESLSMIGILRDPLIRHITFIVLTLHFTQQWIGMNAVMFYSTTIFSDAFDPDMAKYMSIATMGVNFVVTVLSVLLIDHMGRRPLLLMAEAGCVLFSMLLVIGYALSIPALLVLSVFLYVASFAIGIGPIPWVRVSYYGLIACMLTCTGCCR